MRRNVSGGPLWKQPWSSTETSLEGATEERTLVSGIVTTIDLTVVDHGSVLVEQRLSNNNNNNNNKAIIIL